MSPISRLLSLSFVVVGLLSLMGCDGLFYDFNDLDEPGCSEECVAPENGTSTCVGIVCEMTCDDGFDECGGQCVDTENDDEHCGGCGQTCGEDRCVVGACTSCDPDATPFGGGEGTSAEPYLLCSPEHLTVMLDGEELARPLTGHFSLYGDIDMQGVELSASSEFRGVFDGGTNTISNLEVDNRLGMTGVFSELSGTAEITDLNIENLGVSSSSSEIAGGLVGEISDKVLISGVSMSDIRIENRNSMGAVVGINRGTIDDVLVEDFSIELIDPIDFYEYGSDPEYGGIATINFGTIRNAQAFGAMGHESSLDLNAIGGLVGLNEGTIEDSMANVDFGDDVGTTVGGLVGENVDIIRRSYTIGEVRGGGGVGGLVGKNTGEIRASYSEADIYGESFLGGFVGTLQGGGAIHNSYAVGDVNFAVGVGDGGGDLGGFVGLMMNDPVIRYSYSTGTVGTGQVAETIGGFGGSIMGEPEIFHCHWDLDTSSMDRPTGTESEFYDQSMGLRTEQFRSTEPNSRFIDWDFQNIWRFGIAPDGQQRPILQWQSDGDP